MERVDITRAYLETLSSADLNDLAEEYGIDIPEDLTRRFVIAELLEAAVEDADREQFVLLSSGSRMLRADLIAEFSERRPMELCRSELVPIPHRHPDISSISLRKNFPAVLALSGLPDLIRSQYNEHRQSFSSDD